MRKSRLASPLLVLLLTAAPVSAQMPAEERKEIEAIVRDYLLSNPELIEEAVTILRDRREKEAATAQATAIEERRDLIFDSPNQMVLGNPQGPITLVEFFDYNCGYCKRAVSDMTALIEANPDLRFVMKEFPILSEGSVEAARISVAVKEKAPERFMEFHEQLLTRPGEANGGKALEIARELGLDSEVLKSIANSEQATRNLAEVQQLAAALGISGTPSYVIGNELVPGAAGFDVLQQKVGAMRECGKTTCSP